MGKRKTPQRPQVDNAGNIVDSETEITEQDIDQTLKESFPASDPLPWTLGSTRKQDPETTTPGAPEKSGAAAGGPDSH